MRCLLVLLFFPLSLIADDASDLVSDPVEMLGGNPVYGVPMPREGVVVNVAQAVADPEQFFGKPTKFAGRITEVCQNKGCWTVLADEEHYLRVTFKDYGFFIPRDSNGDALVYGLLQEAPMDTATAEHLAQEGDERALSAGSSELRVVAQSILIKGD